MASGIGLKGLKIIVIAMGVLLIAGFVLLVAALGQRIADLYGNEGPEAAPYALDLALAPLERVRTMAGVGDRLALLIERPDGSTRVIVVDPAAGRIVGTIGTAAP